MKLDLFDAIQSRLVRREPGPVGPVVALAMGETPEPQGVTMLAESFRWRAEAVFHYETIKPRGAERAVTREAATAFMHHVYGPIRSELIELMIELRQSGADDLSPAGMRVRAMLDALEVRI